MKVAERKDTREQPLRCAICHGEQDVQMKLLNCSACSATHHLDCINEFAKCPTLGCGAEIVVKKKCWNCNGLGRERVSEMCRAHWYDCNRCGGTGYQVDWNAPKKEQKPAEAPKKKEEDGADCSFDDRRSALYRQMCICGYHTTPAHEVQRVEFDRMRQELERLREEAREEAHQRHQRYTRDGFTALLILTTAIVFIWIVFVLKGQRFPQ